MTEFEHDGQAFTMRLGFAAMAAYSRQTGRAMPADLARLDRFDSDPDGPEILATAFWACLSPKPVLETVPDMIDALGLQRVSEMLTAAAVQAAPGTAAPNPPQASTHG